MGHHAPPPHARKEQLQVPSLPVGKMSPHLHRQELLEPVLGLSLEHAHPLIKMTV